MQAQGAISCPSAGGPGLTSVGLDKLLAAHEYPAQAAARILNTALVWRKHFHKNADHARRRKKLPELLTLGAGKLRQEILVHAPEPLVNSRARN